MGISRSWHSSRSPTQLIRAEPHGVKHYAGVRQARVRERPTKAYSDNGRGDRSGGPRKDSGKSTGKVIPLDRSKGRTEPAKLSNYSGKSDKKNDALSKTMAARPPIDPSQSQHELVADAIACGIDVYVYPVNVSSKKDGDTQDLASGGYWGVHVPNCDVILVQFAERSEAEAWCRKVGLTIVR